MIEAWHGTTADFESFDRRHLGSAVRNPTTEFGFWFSEDREDAAYWAHRAVERGVAKGAPILLRVALDFKDQKIVSEAKFRFYLQTARVSTIQRDLAAWKAAGHDGIATIRGGRRWFCAFDPQAIEILAKEPVPAPYKDIPGL